MTQRAGRAPLENVPVVFAKWEKTCCWVVWVFFLLSQSQCFSLTFGRVLFSTS